MALIDEIVIGLDRALRTVAAEPIAERTNPGTSVDDASMDDLSQMDTSVSFPEPRLTNDQLAYLSDQQLASFIDTRPHIHGGGPPRPT